MGFLVNLKGGLPGVGSVRARFVLWYNEYVRSLQNNKRGILRGFKRWQFWVGMGVSAIFLFLALRRVNLPLAGQRMLAARWEYLVAAWLCLIGCYVVRTLRWYAIVRAIGRVSPGWLGQVYMAGLMANNILPMRIGELVRAYLLGQTARVSTAAALGTIAVERIFDLIMALALLLVGAALGLLADLRQAAWMAGALVAALVGGLVLLAVRGEWLIGWFERAVGRLSPAWAERLAQLGRSFVQGLRAVHSVGQALWLVLGTAVLWGLVMGYALFILRAYDLPVSLAGAAFMLGMAGMGVAIPSGPGSVGTLEGAYMLALQLLGVGTLTSRASFALTYHVLEWVTTLLIGLFCLARLGLSLGQLSRLAERGQPTGET